MFGPKAKALRKMEVKVKPKAIESTILATKEEDEKNMKERVVIGQETEEEIGSKGQETMKILEGLRQKFGETKQDDSKNEPRSSSSSSSPPSSSLEMMKKLQNGKFPIFCSICCDVDILPSSLFFVLFD